MKTIKKIISYITIFTIILISSGCNHTIETKPIKGLNFKNYSIVESKGVFALGIGVYSNKATVFTEYYLYIKRKEGFRFKKIDSESVEIVETDEIPPSIKGVFCNDEISPYYHDYIIYVPTGTIYEEYKSN